VAFTAPVPRPPRRFRERNDRWITLSRHPGSWPVLHRFTPAQSDTSDIVSHDAVPDTFVPDAAPARPPFTLTATLFGALRTSLFEALMPPADFCNNTTDVRATSPELSFPRRDDGLDHLPFLTHHARPSRVAP